MKRKAVQHTGNLFSYTKGRISSIFGAGMLWCGLFFSSCRSDVRLKGDKPVRPLQMSNEILYQTEQKCIKVEHSAEKIPYDNPQVLETRLKGVDYEVITQDVQFLSPQIEE